MELQEVKSNLNKPVSYKGTQYKLTACILRKGAEGLYYSAELLDTKHGNSVLICKLNDVEVIG